MGRFETEIDLLTHSNIRDCSRNFPLVVLNNDHQSLEEHTNVLMRRFIED